MNNAVSLHGASNVIVLYAGFEEGPEFFKAASAHDVLDDIRWFGANQHTAWPNIQDDPTSAKFADTVRFTTIAPVVSDNANSLLNAHINDHLRSLGISDSDAPSAYASYAYDAVWLLGLSILDAQSTNPADVRSQIHPTSERYVGAIGSAELNEYGDLKEGKYDSWLFTYGDTDSGTAAGGWIMYDESSDPGYMGATKKICR